MPASQESEMTNGVSINRVESLVRVKSKADLSDLSVIALTSLSRRGVATREEIHEDFIDPEISIHVVDRSLKIFNRRKLVERVPATEGDLRRSSWRITAEGRLLISKLCTAVAIPSSLMPSATEDNGHGEA